MVNGVTKIMSYDEEVIGRHESGIELVEGANTSISRYYCGNCTKKIHCYVKVDPETRVAKIHMTCKNKECECKCKTHYACKLCGYLHPHGLKCSMPRKIAVTDPNNDDFIEMLNQKFNESKKQPIESKKQ